MREYRHVDNPGWGTLDAKGMAEFERQNPRPAERPPRRSKDFMVGVGAERRRTIAAMDKAGGRVEAIDDEVARLESERAELMVLEERDEARVDTIGDQLEKLRKKHEREASEIEGCVARLKKADKADVEAAAAGIVEALQRERERLEPFEKALEAAITMLESVDVDQLFVWDAVCHRTRPLYGALAATGATRPPFPADDARDRNRYWEKQALRLRNAYGRILDPITRAQRFCNWSPPLGTPEVAPVRALQELTAELAKLEANES